MVGGRRVVCGQMQSRQSCAATYLFIICCSTRPKRTAIKKSGALPRLIGCRRRVPDSQRHETVQRQSRCRASASGSRLKENRRVAVRRDLLPREVLHVTPSWLSADAFASAGKLSLPVRRVGAFPCPTMTLHFSHSHLHGHSQEGGEDVGGQDCMMTTVLLNHRRHV